MTKRFREYWLPLPGYEDYAVSNTGRVASLYRTKRGGLREVRVPARIMRQTKAGNYLWVQVINNGHRRRLGVHQIVAMAFLPPVPGSEVIAHENGNPLDNRVENLRRKTYKENAADMVRHGTVLVGFRNKSCRVSFADVQAIRRMRADGMRPCAIAKAVLLPYHYVWKICTYSNERSIA